MEIKRGKDRVILTEEEAKILINARDILYDIHQDSSDDDLIAYSYAAANELNNFLSDMDIEVEIEQKEPTTKVVVVSLDEFEF